MDAKQYTYRVAWSEEDKEFVGLCSEFPSLSWLSESQAEAFDGIVAVVRDVLVDMEKNGEKIPPPLSMKKYSGKVVLRMPPEIHRQVAMAAAEQGVSLNLYLNSLIGNRKQSQA